MSTCLRTIGVRRRRRRSLAWKPERLESKALLSAFFVNAVADLPDAAPGDGAAAAADGSVTLRAAIEEANANSGRDTVVLPAGIFELTSTWGVDGALTITEDLTLLGAGSGRTTIDALAVDQAFVLSDFTALRLDSLTVLSGADVEPVIGTRSVVEYSDAAVVPQLEVEQTEAPVDPTVDPITDDDTSAAPAISNLLTVDTTTLAASNQQIELIRQLFSRSFQTPVPMPLLAVAPLAVSPSSQRLDITLDSGSPAGHARLLSDQEARPESPRGDDVPRLAINDADGPATESVRQRRDDVVNSLFENSQRPDTAPSLTSPVVPASGVLDQPPTLRPEEVPLPEDVGSGLLFREPVSRNLEPHDTESGFDLPLLIPDSTEESIDPIDAPLDGPPNLLPDPEAAAPLLPVPEEQVSIAPSGTSTLAGLLALAAYQPRWLRVRRRQSRVRP